MRAFVPAKIRDNPSVNREEYISNLMHLGPVVRERLMNGDWTIMPTGLIKAEWLRYYTMRDKMVDLLISRPDTEGNMVHTTEVLCSFHVGESRRFITVDTAGGMKDITAAAKGKSYSWTVAGVWDHKRLGENQALMLKHVWRARVGFVEVSENLIRLHETWHPSITRVEDKTMGPDLCDLLKGKIPIAVIGTGVQDKVARSGPFQNMMAEGQVYLPRNENTWCQTYIAEILSWQGIEGETNDQIDMSSYAAIEIGGYLGGTMVLDIDPRKPMGITKKDKW